jgi:pyruvate dehydrogenase E2 component (dihydrolipoamide acetyltransferase)
VKVSNLIEIRVPDIGDFSDIPVIEVLVSEGDRVNTEDSLVTLESDKATMEVPSPASGVIRELKLKIDDQVSEGTVVALLEVPDEMSTSEGGEKQAEKAGQPVPEPQPPGDPKSKQAATETRVKTPAQEVSSAPVADASRVPYASPAIRRFARELGVDLRQVTGSGNRGRIIRRDVSAFVKTVMRSGAGVGAAGSAGIGFSFPPLPKTDYSRYGEIERKPLSRIKKISAGHLHRNWVGIPHVTQHDEADITDMEVFRKANSERAIARGFKLTPLVFLIKATVAALKEFPGFNASLDVNGEDLILKKYFNIGIAVNTPGGLVVPVIHNCDRKGIMDLAAELAELSGRARENKLKPQDIQGGCFSISSLGGIGGTAFTPIINAPEVAVLGVSRSRMMPVWNGDEFEPRLMLPLSLSYDHRAIDGAEAAQFCRYLASHLEDQSPSQWI